MSNYDSDQFDEITEMSEIKEVSVPSLSVVVDFNDLLERFPEADTWRLLSTLKDLLT